MDNSSRSCRRSGRFREKWELNDVRDDVTLLFFFPQQRGGVLQVSYPAVGRCWEMQCRVELVMIAMMC